MSMSSRIVEAADRLIESPNLHPVTRTFPEIIPMLEDKRDWWEKFVHTIAREDEHKSVLDILELGWLERREAEEATGWAKLVELGDVGVFVSAGLPRELLVNAHDSVGLARMANKQSLYLAHYMFDELAKLESEFPNAYEQMRHAVFAKIKRNFPTQLNPPLPEVASREAVRMVYQASYQTSRELRTFAKKDKGLKIADTGLPDEWSTVYRTNGPTPEPLLDVKAKTLEQMVTVAKAYREAFGPEEMGMLKKHWEDTAPGMIGELSYLLV